MQWYAGVSFGYYLHRVGHCIIILKHHIIKKRIILGHYIHLSSVSLECLVVLCFFVLE